MHRAVVIEAQDNVVAFDVMQTTILHVLHTTVSIRGESYKNHDGCTYSVKDSLVFQMGQRAQQVASDAGNTLDW